MIKIIKDGKKPIRYHTIYIITCPDCGCEFECGLEDFKIEKTIDGNNIITIDGNKIIMCPCCNKELNTKNLEHIGMIKEEMKEITPFIPWKHDLLSKDGTYPDPNYKDPCDTCPNRFGPRDGLGNPIVGDSPCQWCSHYKYKFTCGSGILGDAHESKN